jgi:hypothetical protein
MNSRRRVNSDVRRLFLMGIDKYEEQLGAPDIKLNGLQIWIHGRQFPDAMDYWDGNWLRITAHCGTHGADVWTTGSILHIPDIVRWLAELERMKKSLSGEANLIPMEPELRVKLAAAQLGHISMEVEITPDNVTQEHTFRFDLDQSYLEPVIDSCRKLVAEYAVRGTPAD